MEASLDPNMLNKQPSKQKGGLRAIPFIIANEAFEKVASFGLLPNMVFYLIGGYHMSLATATSVLSLWSAATNFLPLIGAFVSDSYLGRYQTIIIGCLFSLWGMSLLWFTSMFPAVKPPHCPITSTSCESATPAQLLLLYASFGLMSIGAGCIRPCSIAFGAGQLDKEDNPNNKRVLQSFFNWYYVAATVSIMVAITVIVYIQDQFGWKIGFGVPVIIMFVSVLCFVMASSLYIKDKPKKSLFSGFVQVSVASFRKRHVALPPKTQDGSYYYGNDSKMVMPSERLRFLNRACFIRDHKQELGPDGLVLNRYSLCTVEQVEELKALLKVIPLWSTGIIIAVTISPFSFPAYQAKSMDRHITSTFQIPAGSFGIFGIATLTIWIAIYDRLLVPQLAKITRKPQGLAHRQRMGIGLVISCMAMAVSALVESIRRRTAIKQGFADYPQTVLDMSAMWLVPQHCLIGLAEAFNAIGQIEFYYSQFPKTMSSLALGIFSLSMAIGNGLVALIVKVLDSASPRGDQESWVSSNINKAHWDYYYWILTILSVINFLYYLLCCWAYGPGDGERIMAQKEDEDLTE